ncbi:MAG: guanylate kinase [Paenibacillus macerans]|uniref:guanylate kinase n=1 Tax=Paenibacillus macerans TaxID=44252 RepID=UPI001F0EEA3B|nr:guanylate kinase [Paenibacillus macerans]MDU7473607.1 guanylate kinase [Paenibacillus macerans]MEC0139191.1 guanylate kinase [Paenibacillus macerans]UMV47272.1 guanylate kinase [Paenibacillus macerans]
MQEMAQDILLNLALAALTLLSSYALYYLRKAKAKVSAEAAKIANDDQRALAQAAIMRLDDVATKTVKTIEQTTAKELRRAVKNGQASKEDLAALARQAYGEIVRTMEPDYLDALKTTLGDLDKYIKTTIEAKVLELKQNAVISEALEMREV